MKRRYKRRVTLISSILAVCAVVAASLAIAGGRDETSVRTVSAKGTKVSLSTRAHRGAKFLFDGSLPELYLLGIRADRAFYRLVGEDGQTCFAVGFANSVGKPGSIGCWRQLNALMDYSTVEVVRGSREPRLLRIEGFAADGVTRVQAMDESGRTVAEAPVTANIYHLGAPTALVMRLVALDRSGDVVGGLQFPRPAAQPSS